MTNSISKNLVFIDGITRCGKSLFSGIIPSFENMEHIQFHNQLELIIPTAGLGAIDLNFAKKFSICH